MSRPGRRSIFNVTTRNVNDHKLLEKPLSTEIDQNLRVLALFHPFSHELKAIYTEVCNFSQNLCVYVCNKIKKNMFFSNDSGNVYEIKSKGHVLRYTLFNDDL